MQCSNINISPPKTTEILLKRAQQLAGLSLREVAAFANSECPENFLKHKGWLGKALETILGASANSQSMPDFPHLQIELKTLPVTALGQPQETTFVTYAPIPFREKDWQNSSVYRKLKHVLWIPYLAQGAIGDRCIGQPFLWHLDAPWAEILQDDWQELVQLLKLQQFEKINASIGRYLHLRPKALNSKVVKKVLGSDGALFQVVPKGFYLRTDFTHDLLRTFF